MPIADVNPIPPPPSRSRDACCRWFLHALCLGAFAANSLAAPVINSFAPRGLGIGQTTTVVIDGADLLPSPRLLLSSNGLDAKLKPNPAPNRVEFDITIPKSASPGIHLVRLASDQGISNAVLVGIDDLPQQPFSAEIKSLPVALTGQAPGNTVAKTTFEGKKGQRIVLDLEARRLGSTLDPVIELLDPRRVQLAWSQGQPLLGGDCRLDVTLPADGRYAVEIHDAVYSAQAPAFFRLKAGDLHYADVAFPLGVSENPKEQSSLLGHVPGDAKGSVDRIYATELAPLTLPSLPRLTGAPPSVLIDGLPAHVEGARHKFDLPTLKPPVAIDGRLRTPGEEDIYRLEVTPGSALRFDFWAQRLNSPVDGLIVLRNELGQELAQADDRPGATDPLLDFTVPAGVTRLLVGVTDLHRRGGPSFVYRLRISPVSNAPDYSLTLFEDRHHAPLSGNALIRVRANRVGYTGPIKLRFSAVPDGLTIENDEIPAFATDALVSLDSFSLRPGQQVTSVDGESVGGGPGKRRALLPEGTGTATRPWLRSELGLAVTGPGAVAIHWDHKGDILPLGHHVDTRPRVTRAAGLDGPVRLSILTSQVVPKLPDGKDDEAKALRLASAVSIPANQSEGGVRITVPGDLPVIPYDIAIRAELLSADGKQVRASATSRSRRMFPRRPIQIQLTSAPSLEARAGEGPTGSIAGKIERLDDFKVPVSLVFNGLPADIAPVSTELGADKYEFNVPVRFPAGTKVGAVPNVRLSAVAAIEPLRTTASNEVPIALNIVAGTPASLPGLVRLFEEEASFPMVLTEGDAQAGLDPSDRYSGQASLRVTKFQRYRTVVPSWNYKITEKPEPGQFRYLRFAWKKTNGPYVLLQLGINGRFGPTKGMPGPSFRYEAGSASNSLNLAAVRLGEKRPNQWEVVTRDLFADFGEFQLTGLAFTAGMGEREFANFDHLYLARTLDDFKACPAPLTNKPLAKNP